MPQKSKSKTSTRTSAGSHSKSGLLAIIQQPLFSKLYALGAIIVLLATTLFWSLLGARLQSSNADQLANANLFEHARTFQQASLPGQHSFLLKWPIFLLIKTFGYSSWAFVAATVLTVLITVALFAFILYRIEQRRLVFGTLCLALASVLLLVPAVPYAGALLPVNMAMLTTRNVEYIIYLIGLALLIRSPRLRSWKFGLAVLLLSLLVASDKLFLIIGLGGALLALVAYALSKGWKLVNTSVRWFMGAALAAVGGSLILWALNSVTHIVSSGTVGPYGLVHNFRSLVLGSVYGVLGLFTNFGANPAYNATVLRNIPHQLLIHLISLAGPSYVINLLVFACGLYAAWKILRASVATKRTSPDVATTMSIMLLCSSVAAFGFFVATNHYYAVDARYVTIALFALFVTAAVFTRKKHWRPERLVIAGGVIGVSILLSLAAVVHTYHTNQAALAPINNRNARIVQALARDPVNKLVGDYWRVIPIKLATHNTQQVVPLESCTQPRQVLSSLAWQTNWENGSFAYLLSFDKSLTNYPNCTLDQVDQVYGRPNASILISGTVSKPTELLLLYSHGKRKVVPASQQKTKEPATVVPVTTSQLYNTTCTVPTIMNIVAHQDDDLLFMNPDLLHSIQAGYCVRTIYITAGDAGNGQYYWLSRQLGSEAAYSSMLGTNTIWIQRIVEVANNEYVTIANPSGNSHISLIFMHLPDGNLNGQGFSDSHFESLAKLYAGQIKTMQNVDGESSYTSAQLVSALSTLMQTYQPTEIRTQANFISKQYPDHSDHMAVGRFVKLAYKQYEANQFQELVNIPLKFYIGYPIHAMPANVSGSDLAAKEATFLAYAKYDSGVCQSAQACNQSPTYGTYLKREYQNAY